MVFKNDMHFQKNVLFFSLLLVVWFCLTIYSVGCNKSTLPPNTFSIPKKVSYKKFELKSDDIRLEYFKNPLYSFEYPEIFRLANAGREIHGSLSPLYSRVYCIILQLELPEPILEIEICNPGSLDRNTPGDVIKYWTSREGTKWNDISMSMQEVSGIQADCLETFGTMEEFNIYGKQIYPEHYMSLRGVAFNYAGLIWSVSMTWHYLDSEPPEIQGYFDHVINTFRILE